MIALSKTPDAALEAKAQAMLQLRPHIGMHVAVSARAVVGCNESGCFTVANMCIFWLVGQAALCATGASLHASASFWCGIGTM